MRLQINYAVTNMRSYKYYAKLQILCEVTNIMRSYKYYAKLQILCEVTNIMRSYKYYAKLQICEVTNMRSYKYAKLQIIMRSYK